MKKVLTEVAITVVSPFAALLVMCSAMAALMLFAGGFVYIMLVAGWVDQVISTPIFLLSASAYTGLVLFGFYGRMNDLFEKMLRRGVYILPALLLGGFIITGIVVNCF